MHELELTAAWRQFITTGYNDTYGSSDKSSHLTCLLLHMQALSLFANYDGQAVVLGCGA